MLKTLIAAATVATFSAPALAQQPTTVPAKPQAAMDEAFAKHDMDKSGSLTIAEVKMADATVTPADFDKYDADKSKSLSKDEFAKWAEAKSTPPASSPGQ